MTKLVYQFCFLAPLWLCALAQSQPLGPKAAKALPGGRAEIRQNLGQFEKFSEVKGEINQLIERLAEANERDDRGSMFYIGSLIVQRAWKGLTADVRKWASEHADTKALDPSFCDALVDLNRFAERLERISVGPFLYDQKKEEAMVAGTRDRLFLTKVLMKSLLEKVDAEWRDKLPKWDIDVTPKSLFSEIVTLRRDVTLLKADMEKLSAHLESKQGAGQSQTMLECRSYDCGSGTWRPRCGRRR